MADFQAKKYALLSVSNKTGIVDLAKKLRALGYSIISTGGTAKALTEQGIQITPVQEITNDPESFDGRMKTISFEIESGILFDRSNASHVEQAKSLNIKPIDIVVCNLYPFEKTIAQKNVSLKNAVENIDVGGPTMVRSGAKNFKHVVVVVDPADYETVENELEQGISLAKRKELAAKAFAHLSFYDSQIAKYLQNDVFPKVITLAGRKTIDLRYGENPHQKAAVYMYPNTSSPLASLIKRTGRDLSHVNVTDIYAGLESIRLFKTPAAVVVKHNSPCGIALGSSAKEALARAIEADAESAFGGIIVLNHPMDMQTASIIASFKDEKRGNIDIVAVPSIDKAALAFLQSVRKTMGIYTFGTIPDNASDTYHTKYIDGGFILQTPDNNIEESFNDWKIVTEKKPTKKQLEQMKIAWKFVSRIKSNTIIVMDQKLPMTRGIGCGQTSRIRSAKIALEQAGAFCKGSILASDSFFPFDDSVILAAKSGISAIVQQGGSINDKLSIAAADKHGIAMVFTNRREFWH